MGRGLGFCNKVLPISFPFVLLSFVNFIFICYKFYFLTFWLFFNRTSRIFSFSSYIWYEIMLLIWICKLLRDNMDNVCLKSILNEAEYHSILHDFLPLFLFSCRCRCKSMTICCIVLWVTISVLHNVYIFWTLWFYDRFG